MGVYWEVSGPDTDSISVAVGLIPYSRGLLGRIGESLTLLAKRAALTLEWSTKGPIVAFELDLRRLRPGKYRLRLEATAPSGWRQAATRDIEVTDATEGPPPKD